MRLFYAPVFAARALDAATPIRDRMPMLILYQRDDCHLCDLALAMLADARAPEFDSVFIDGDEALEARYGMRVPVLRDDGTGIELDWPFDAEALQALLCPPL